MNAGLENIRRNDEMIAALICTQKPPRCPPPSKRGYSKAFSSPTASKVEALASSVSVVIRRSLRTRGAS
ncbi:hypothetical protein HPP92_023529 [Vanilla planifolia]|uniref:Uncharacterized protein n=1 Tax=Vanilla planifolia TaxID=51239 RepID=A0A835UDV0_VANPL|nr:hypothetical protein HPP92_023529 [Vanilla planifolia]